MERLAITINGQARHYFHLYDTGVKSAKTPVIYIDGSGCRGDIGPSFQKIMSSFARPLNAYMLQKAGVEDGSDGSVCAEAFRRQDLLEIKAEDQIAFIDSESSLKAMGQKSLALFGYSEGANVALLIAARNKKIGWLAIGGNGGLKQSDNFLVFARREFSSNIDWHPQDFFLSMFQAIKRDPESLEKYFFGFPYRYWNSHLFFDPLPFYAGLRIPVVVAMGEKDEAVPVESGRFLNEYFKLHPKRDFQYIEFKGADHGLSMEKDDGLAALVRLFPHWFQVGRAAFQPLLHASEN